MSEYESHRRGWREGRQPVGPEHTKRSRHAPGRSPGKRTLTMNLTPGAEGIPEDEPFRSPSASSSISVSMTMTTEVDPIVQTVEAKK